MDEQASLERQARILEMVLDLAGSLPFKGRGELQYPPLIRLAKPRDQANSSTECGPTQATARLSATPAATVRTSWNVT